MYPGDDHDDVGAVERAMVRIRRSQTRRALARQAAREAGAPVDVDLVGVLDAVEEGPDDGGPVAVRTVAARLGIDPSRASRLAARAVASGHLVRVAAQGDARRVGLDLTDRGRAALAEVRTTRRARFAAVLRDWSPQDRHALAVLLTRFTDDLARRPADPPRPG